VATDERRIQADNSRQNLLISIVNSRVTSEMLYAEIHPKLTDYGDTPREFARPKRVEEFYAMDGMSCACTHILLLAFTLLFRRCPVLVSSYTQANTPQPSF
jgi:hypothetical protein